jgi:peptide/nickel transport system permease protein
MTTAVTARARRVSRLDWPGRVAAGILALLVIAGLVGWITGTGQAGQQIVGPRLAGPGHQWPLGTDELGRSLLPRVIDGIGTTLLLSAFAVVITTCVALILGLVAGYVRGYSDLAIGQGVNLLFAFPPIVLALLVSAVVGPGTVTIVSAIVLVTLPTMVRVIRATAGSVAGRDFVLTARVGGASTWWILSRHVLPSVAGAVIVQLTYALSVAMIVESSLSFLGFGVQPPSASLGTLLQEAVPFLSTDPWYLVSPGAVLAIGILSVNTLGDSLRDALDPRERRALA